MAEKCNLPILISRQPQNPFLAIPLGAVTFLGSTNLGCCASVAKLHHPPPTARHFFAPQGAAAVRARVVLRKKAAQRFTAIGVPMILDFRPVDLPRNVSVPGCQK